MHGGRRRILPIIILLAAIGAGVYFYLQSSAGSSGLTVSGSIEAVEVNLGSITGGRVDQVDVEEGDGVAIDEVVAIVNSAMSGSRGREMIHTPLAGVVLYRHVEPGEIVSAGAPLLTVIDLDNLELTVYVPEDRYGRIQLGQVLPVAVDSYPGETFQGTVRHIADQAEFTPRNVQTTDNRKTTVFAVRLALESSGGKLKPGMPADVYFDLAQ
jgi:multidrug resistance efflux pump